MFVVNIGRGGVHILFCAHVCPQFEIKALMHNDRFEFMRTLYKAESLFPILQSTSDMKNYYHGSNVSGKKKNRVK